MTTAGDMMNPLVVHLERSATVYDAATIMAQKKLGCVIITADDYPIGIITETDIVRLVANGANTRTVHVDEIMSSPLFSTNPDEDLLSVASTMSGSRIKKMPVMHGQRIVGIITQTDIVHFALRAIEDIHHEYTKGNLSANEFSKKANELFLSVPKTANTTKEWHMRCRSCGLRFLAEEKNGVLQTKSCPSCNGDITYDLAPPI